MGLQERSFFQPVRGRYLNNIYQISYATTQVGHRYVMNSQEATSPISTLKRFNTKLSFISFIHFICSMS